jgi:hypothetical protein
VTASRRIPLSAWLKYRFEDPSWLVLIPVTGLIGSLALGEIPTGPAQVLRGEVVDLAFDGRWRRSAVVRFDSGKTGWISLPTSIVCAKGDRLRVFETHHLLATGFAPAPEGCVRPPR